MPPWAPDPAVGARLINARVETVADRPAFRAAFAARRCLLPADGWYEWTTDAAGRRQPYHIRRSGGGTLALAGLYERWTAPDGRRLDTCTVLTTAAPADLVHLHHRAPVVVPTALWSAWLDPGRDQAGLRAELSCPAGLAAYPVAPLVNDVRHDGPDLVAPAAAPVPTQPRLF